MRINAAHLSAALSCVISSVWGNEADLAYDIFLPNVGCKTEHHASCKEFSSYFKDELTSNGNTAAPDLKVPCDVCVTMSEYTSGQRIEIGMIDVIGAMVFPSSTKMKLVTKGIVVQGKLIMERDEDTVIDGNPDVIIELTGNEDLNWVPTEINQDACEHPSTGDMACLLGKRAVVVAGGTVDIQAFPKQCITWTHLFDVEGDDLPLPTNYPKMIAPKGGSDCSERILINDDFTGGNLGSWKGSLGTTVKALEENGSSYVEISGRTRKWQGIGLDITNNDKLLPCLQADVDYLFSITARLDTTNGVASDCFSNGNNCLSFKTQSMNSDREMKWKTLYTVPGVVGKAADNEWFTIGVPIKFSQEDIDDSGVYAQFYVAGPEEGVGISISNIILQLPDEKFFKDPNKQADMCRDLVHNGDAEVDDLFYYPLIYCGPRRGILSVEKDASGNNYFSVKGRVKDFVSIETQFTTDCITTYSTYLFKARIWLHSDEPRKVRFTTRTVSNDPDTPDAIENIGFCPESSESIGWVQCERVFQFTATHAESKSIRLIMVADGDSESDIDYDDISVTILSTPVTTIILNTTDVGCWGEGADIMVTSHTLEDKDTEAVTITDVEVDTTNKRTTIKIDRPIVKHTSLKDSDSFAVEVALLSRQVLIHSPKDVEPLQPLHGGHVMFLHTADQAQLVEGVEFRNMGQQGLRGRYPLHFHMSESVFGTLISKNTVRESNQRCFVIHGTHNVTLRDNVAFDTFGHCYMVEDGFEQDNHFEYNIGARTKVTPDVGILSLEESDMFASTFWISNPNNYFLGNVCAGGEDTGFWYEFLEFVRGPSSAFDPYHEINPSKFSFGAFENNVMHSYKGDGFKLYPNGYFPEVHANFVGTKSFKNIGDGVLFHNSAKLSLEGGIYADNRIQIEIDKQSDDVWVSDAKVIGYSPLFRKEVEASNTKSHCPANRPNVGIQLHSFLRYKDSHGYNLTNIVFSDFGESQTGCIGSTAMEVDPEVRDGHFDAYSIFSNLSFPDGATNQEKFSICDLEKYGKISDLVIQDLTGDLNPIGSEPGSIVSRGGKMTFFENDCVEMEGSCAYYCKQTCYRGFNIAIPQSVQYNNWTLKAKSGTDEVAFDSYFDELTMNDSNGNKVPHHEDNYNFERRRYFTASLPYGNFTLRFLDNHGNIGWPTIAEQMWEDPVECGNYIDDANINLIVPDPTFECDNVVKNHDAEEGIENHWMHTGGDVQIVSPGYGGSNYAIASVKRNGQWQGPGQFLDSRCFQVGQTYTVSAKFRLQDEITAAFVSCDVNEQSYMAHEVCPRMSFRMRKLTGNRINDPVETTFAYPIAETLLPLSADDWNTMFGSFTVTPRIANQTNIALFFEQVRPNVRIIVDDVIVELTNAGCSDSSYNRGFETGDSRFWSHRGEFSYGIVTPGYISDYAVKMTNRGHYWSSIEQAISPDCLVEGREYSITAKVKLEKNGAAYDCSPHVEWGVPGEEYLSCPVITLQTYAENKLNNAPLDVSKVVGKWESGEWNHLHGVFTATKEMIEAPKLTYFFQKVVHEVDLILDDIQIKEVVYLGCDDLITNGDGEMSEKPLYWSASSVLDITTPGFNSSQAIISSERSNAYAAAVTQKIDSECIQLDDVYQVNAMLKTTGANGDPFGCDIHQTYISENIVRCPMISIAAQNLGAAPQKRAIAAPDEDWVADGWNSVSGNFTFFANEIAAHALWIEFSLAGSDVLLVDDVSVKVIV